MSPLRPGYCYPLHRTPGLEISLKQGRIVQLNPIHLLLGINRVSSSLSLLPLVLLQHLSDNSSILSFLLLQLQHLVCKIFTLHLLLILCNNQQGSIKAVQETSAMRNRSSYCRAFAVCCQLATTSKRWLLSCTPSTMPTVNMMLPTHPSFKPL